MKDFPTPEQIAEKRMEFMLSNQHPNAGDATEAILILFKLAERFAEQIIALKGEPNEKQKHDGPVYPPGVDPGA